MKVFVATQRMQNLTNTDVFFCREGEIVIPEFSDRHLDPKEQIFEKDDFYLIGIDTRKATTTFLVVDLKYSKKEIHEAIKKSLLSCNLKYNEAFIERFINLANSFETDDVCEIEKRKIVKRCWN